jgi:hypothetical protein
MPDIYIIPQPHYIFRDLLSRFFGEKFSLEIVFNVDTPYTMWTGDLGGQHST